MVRTDYLSACLDRWCEGAWSAGQHVFLMLDGHWQADLCALARSRGDGWVPLFHHPAEPRRDAHPEAPLLVDLSLRRDLLPLWLDGSFRDRLGVVVFTPLPAAELSVRLERFRYALLPDRLTPALFRFYDGRSLSTFLETGYGTQHLDLLTEITTICTPSDLTEGWTLYRLRKQKLIRAIADGRSDQLSWDKVDEGPDESEIYRASDPIPTIGPQQYAQIRKGTIRGFRRDVARWMAQAFPDRVPPEGPLALQPVIAPLHEIFLQRGLTGDRSAFLWILLGLLAGPGVYDDPQMAALLAEPQPDLATRLCRPLERMNRQLRNAALEELLAISRAAGPTEIPPSAYQVVEDAETAILTKNMPLPELQGRARAGQLGHDHGFPQGLPGARIGSDPL